MFRRHANKTPRWATQKCEPPPPSGRSIKTYYYDFKKRTEMNNCYCENEYDQMIFYNN